MRSQISKIFVLIFAFIFLFVFSQNFISSFLISDQGTDVRDISTGNLTSLANLTISIYDSATDGNLIFQSNISEGIVNGSWNVMINPDLQYGKSYWKDYKINDEDLNFDGNDRLEFQSSIGKINNISFINFSLINSCPAGSSIRLIYENGSVECETDDSGSGSYNDSWINQTIYTKTQVNDINASMKNYVDWVNSTNGAGSGSYSDSWINSTIDSKISINNNSINNYISLSNNSVVNWITATFASLSTIVNAIGNWSADKANYYNTTQVNEINTSMKNYVDSVGGMNGLNGTNGSQGIAGINGLNGTNGSNGINGLNGTNGINGLNGTNGTNGINGLNGTNGINGLNGTNGTDSINNTNWNNNYSAFLTHTTTAYVDTQNTSQTNYINSNNNSINNYILYVNSTNGVIGGTDTFIANYTTFLTHINWSIAMNGTLMKISQWNATNTSYLTAETNWNLNYSSFLGLMTMSNFTTQNQSINNWINSLHLVNGTNGINGLNGTNGSQGIQGVAGINGLNGTNGSQGIQGLQGIAGLNGTNGTNGLNGLNGTNGVSFSNFSLYMTGDNATIQNTSISNYIVSANNTLAGWVDNSFARFTELVAQVGNWSLDKASYTPLSTLNNGTYVITNILNNGSYSSANWNANYSTFLTHINFGTISNGTIWSWVMNGSVMHPNDWNATNTSYMEGSNFTLQNTSMKNYVDSQNTSQTNYINSNNISVTNAINTVSSQWNATNTSYVPYTGANRNVVLGANNFSVNTNTLFIDSTNGRVGIGTTSPLYRFHASSSATWEPLLGFTNTNADDSSGGLFFEKLSGSPAANDYLGFVAFEGKDSGGVQTRFADIYAMATTVTNGNENGALLFRVTNAGSIGQEIMRITNGNVGIGTINPLAKLHVAGSILANGTINATTDLCIQGGVCLSGVTASGGANWNANYSQFLLNNVSVTNSIAANNASMKNYVDSQNTSQTNAMTAQNTSQTNLINLNNISMKNYVDSRGFGNGTINGSGTAWYIPMWNGTKTLNNSVIYQNGSNIGIGTITPLANLDVRGANPGATTYDKTIFGYYNLNANKSDGNIAAIMGQLVISGTRTINNDLYTGLRGDARTDSDHSGTVPRLVGLSGSVLSQGAGSTITSAEAIAADAGWGSNGVINDLYGLKVNFLGTTHVNGYGVYIGEIGASNDNYGIYQTGTSDKNYFGGNVGIGTNNSLATLHVNGSAIINGTLNMDSDKIISLANGTSAQDAVTYSQLLAVNATGGAPETDPKWSANYTAFNASWSNMTNASYMTGSNFTLQNTSMKNYVDSQNTSQTNAMTAQNTSQTNYINYNNASVTNAINAVSNAGEPLWTGNWTNVAFENQANTFGGYNQSFNTSTLFIDSTNGRVGIGTTSPGDTKLHIIKSGGFSESSILLEESGNTTGGLGRFLFEQFGDGAITSYSLNMPITDAGATGRDDTARDSWGFTFDNRLAYSQFRINYFAGTNTFPLVTTINGTKIGNNDDGTPAGLLDVQGTVSGVSFLLVLPNGNVGIGTINPFQKLHVNGSILANGTINATGGFGVSEKSGITGNYSMLNSSSMQCFMNFTGGILFSSTC